MNRRQTLLAVARAVYLEPDFEPAAAADAVLASMAERGAHAKELAEADLEGLELTAREAEQRARRAQRGAEREELLASLDELAAWYRDLVAVAVGAEDAVIHLDRREELREEEELNGTASLSLDALFVRLRREIAAAHAL